MAETAAQRKAREESEKSNEQAVVERPGAEARNVLTEDMAQPPGVLARRRRVARRQRQGPFVKYVGAASDRVIRPSDWGSLGFTPKDKEAGHQQFMWNAKNDYLVESSKFTDEQLDYLLIDDVQHGTNAHSFLEVDFDEDGQLVQVTED